MDKKSVMKNYAFLAILLGAMVLVCFSYRLIKIARRCRSSGSGLSVFKLDICLRHSIGSDKQRIQISRITGIHINLRLIPAQYLTAFQHQQHTLLSAGLRHYSTPFITLLLFTKLHHRSTLIGILPVGIGSPGPYCQTNRRRCEHRHRRHPDLL